MNWANFISYLFGGAFLANAIPHIVSGMMGHPFQSPFAKPSGQGLSSSAVNMVWGFFNLAVAYVLICRVGDFKPALHRSCGHSGTGFPFNRPAKRRHFGRFHGGNAPGAQMPVPVEAHRSSDRLDPLIWKIGSVAVLGSFLSQLDATVVNVPFPALPSPSTAAFRRSSGSRAVIFSRLLSSCL